ncbi:MAG TPA: hypothetical protein VG755_43490 [Nannocystaceae bacterium]|nr:hypothetical protein [Nannocystaceae bacterium]
MQKRSAFQEMTDGPLSAMALVGGLLAIGWGVATIPDSIARMRAGQLADGVVTEDLGHNRMWIQFTTADGLDYGMRGYVKDGKVGDHVEVVYRSDRATPEPVLNDPFHLYPGQTYGFGIGTPIFVMGLLGFIAANRRDRAEAALRQRVSRAAHV